MGPLNAYSKHLHQIKYRDNGETFEHYVERYSRALADTKEEYDALSDAIGNQRLLPAGRQQLAVGRGFKTTAYNCFVGGEIEDSMAGIMDSLKEAALTLRSGGGCGWNFGSLRPSGDPVLGLGVGASSSGPVSFMQMWDSMCGTVHSAGHRRGAMMAVMPVHHPDIFEFIRAKRNSNALNRFNISVGATEDFMEAVASDDLFTLHFGGRRYSSIRALDLWNEIMESNWDYAEPGILFLDRINEFNNLSYCERIDATNPCSEQPLPPYGACLLGSLNIVKFLDGVRISNEKIRRDCHIAVRAFDNVIDRTYYPLEQQRVEAQSKRRMGVGVTGMANALEVMGYVYGSEAYIAKQSEILACIRDACYEASIELARERGAFQLFHEKYLEGKFIATLPDNIRESIARWGIRNSHLLSIAPTGTISICADNVSSGIEPPFALSYTRDVIEPEGKKVVELRDYAYDRHQHMGKTAHETTPQEHIDVLCAAQRFVDSSVSKTCNVASGSFSDFCELYTRAYSGGAKGCSTFNVNGKREGVLKAETENGFVEACFIDPETGVRACE